MFQRRFTRLIAIALVATSTVAVPAPAIAAPGDQIFTFVGGGWGHGVGMSQYGALGRADAGHTAEQILTYYYDGTTVEDRRGIDLINDLRIRLSPNAGKTRPTTATAVADDPLTIDDPATANVVENVDDGLLSLDIDGTVYADIGASVTVTLGAKISSGATEAEDVYGWSVVADGVDVCLTAICQGQRVTLLRRAGDTIRISDSTYGAHDTHRAGDLRLEPDRFGSTGLLVVLINTPMQDYLKGLAEVPSTWHDEAVKAQVIAARSYASARGAGRRASGCCSFDVYNSTSDQVYAGTSKESDNQNLMVDATDGLAVVYANEIVRTFYSSSNGGYTAASEDRWITPEPFHIAKPDPYDPAPDATGKPQNTFWRWERQYTASQLATWFAAAGFATDVGTITEIKIYDLPPSGRVRNATVDIIGTNGTEGGYKTSGKPVISGAKLFNAINAGAANCPLTEPVALDCELRSTKFSVISFTDVAPGVYFEPIIWMAGQSITNGIAPGLFGPDVPITRAQMAAFVWRFADRPAGPVPTPFDDIAPGSLFEQPVAWMADQKITTGTQLNLFSPEATLTRGQLATFLWRYAGEPAAPPNDNFTDLVPNTYYTDAIAWMVEWKITTGLSATSFGPEDPVTRGQVATFLWRLAGTPDAFDPSVTLPTGMRP